MILALDIGNSSISCGVFSLTSNTDIASSKIPESICSFKIASKSLSFDEYLLLFYQFLKLYSIVPAESFYSYAPGLKSDELTEHTPSLKAAVISSVVPSLTETICKVAKVLTGSHPLIIGAGIRTGFGIKIKNPEQLGADIVANTAGAMLYADTPFVILDVGTATTITYVNKDKELLGTIIIPGIAVSLSALTDSAALLSTVPLDKPQELLGKTTSDSIRSGVLGGHALMIDGFLRNIREQYPSEEKIGLIATGGLAECILPFCRNRFQYIHDLTLIGAFTLFRKNRFCQR